MQEKVDKENTPVLLFGFNRPFHTKKTLDSLSNCYEANKIQLIAFIDGPRRASEKYKVENVIKIIKSYSGKFKNIEIHSSSSNKGCDSSIKDGINEAFKSYERIIVLEDDIIVGKNFYKSMDKALKHNDNQKKIFQINGFNFNVPKLINKQNLNKFFLFRVQFTWGWGTWKDRWMLMQNDPLSQDPYFLMESMSDQDRKFFNLDGIYNCWNQVGHNIDGSLDNTWDIFWHAFIARNNGLCLTPYFSMTKNIGCDGSGIHCSQDDNLILSSEVNHSFVHEIPDKIEEDQLIINLIKKRLRYIKIYNLPSRLIRKVIKICKNITKKFLGF